MAAIRAAMTAMVVARVRATARMVPTIRFLPSKPIRTKRRSVIGGGHSHNAKAGRKMTYWAGAVLPVRTDSEASFHKFCAVHCGTGMRRFVSGGMKRHLSAPWPILRAADPSE